MIKEWPKDNIPVQFEDLITPLKKALRFAYKMRRQNRNKDIPYDGYNIGSKEQSSCLEPDYQLTANILKYSKEDQGRDALDEILGIAIRLGIEQGRRI